MNNKKNLSERDICTKFITPALVAAGWDLHSQIREEVSFTKGRIIVRGKLHTRGEQKRADYILYYKANMPLAVIEAKVNSLSLGAGMQQALNYAETLGVPFVFSSNGDGFLMHDRTGLSDKTEQALALDAFPSPAELWQRYCQWKGLETDAARHTVEMPYYDDGSGRTPRYYQANAINRTVEAVAKAQPRILLVMATGTGKTYTAFQIIWRLWKSGAKKRILFLADRNILVDQTKNNDFKPFAAAMTKISKRQVDKSYEIYLSLYQAVTGSEEEQNIYKQFSPDFFDLIVIDECHRGSAPEDSAWREILAYFSSATHIGLTATPKETKDVSSIVYFGEPVYTYSLKQGIEDGFLAPYKVVRIDIDKDLQGWRPSKGQTDKNGQLIEDRVYNQIDMDRTLVLEKRTELVAKKITEFLTATDPYAKTIVFCDDIDHAERMRQALVNLNPERVKERRKYVMRITGDELEGTAELDNFINPEERYPVIATTSKLMTTGVDAQTCKLVVLDQHIKSMTEFKQIIGRGTRINEDYDKYWFTIMDFKKATELFADKDFDGEPVMIYEPKDDASPVPPDDNPGAENDHPESELTGNTGDTTAGEGGDEPRGRVKYVLGDVSVYVIAERVQYYGPEGKLITESLKDYTRSTVRKDYASLDEFLRRWTKAERKAAILQELEQHGLLLEPLADEVGKDFDAFDLICHVAFDQPPLTRRERAEQVKKRNYFAKYGEQARQVLETLLEKYADTGIENIEDIKILTLDPFKNMGTASELVSAFGGKPAYMAALQELEAHLYA
ncbi:Type I restriction-modification system, restriction subunit R (EC 3.1.21.3) [Methylomonas albis]|uniref:DEAD/DEAH box helicase family protein n=1 Tax=Methylomonas albis TaxID=1854563 RepID=A0ABR9D4G7_9GAMM|nr:DEAD/DEAH box helicase family protein [Methylomonas albis]MBD9357681.1 DEAD/DEAH box helicase family protein [Methylomonas albis]CAD6880996.1 Type I restriction-modification system, restriction subunit R (EC 3.1.21.3) [Methylomonas albis]